MNDLSKVVGCWFDEQEIQLGTKWYKTRLRELCNNQFRIDVRCRKRGRKWPDPENSNPKKPFRKRNAGVFWQKGYEDASLPDLLEGMGLTRGSLYKAFKDKKSLFLKVLERYDTMRMLWTRPWRV